MKQIIYTFALALTLLSGVAQAHYRPLNPKQCYERIHTQVFLGKAEIQLHRDSEHHFVRPAPFLLETFKSVEQNKFGRIIIKVDNNIKGKGFVNTDDHPAFIAKLEEYKQEGCEVEFDQIHLPM